MSKDGIMSRSWLNAKKTIKWDTAGKSTPANAAYNALLNAKRLAPVKQMEGLVRNASLYSRIGGEPVLSAWVRNFYGKALKDERIRRYFDFADATEMEAQIQRQIAFIGAVIGGPSGAGQDLHSMYAQLKQLGLTDAHFDALIEHVTATLVGQNVPPPLVEEMKGLCETVRKGVLG